MIIKTKAMKINSRILLMGSLLLAISMSLVAQNSGDRQKRMEQYKNMKIAYFTENLELTPEEAEKFWPVYNKFNDQKDVLRRNRSMRHRNNSDDGKKLTEEEAEVVIDQLIETRQKELVLDVEFHKELKTILPATKIMNFYITEVKFREYMLKRLRQERGNSGSGGQGRSKGQAMN